MTAIGLTTIAFRSVTPPTICCHRLGGDPRCMCFEEPIPMSSGATQTGPSTYPNGPNITSAIS